MNTYTKSALFITLLSTISMLECMTARSAQGLSAIRQGVAGTARTSIVGTARGSGLRSASQAAKQQTSFFQRGYSQMSREEAANIFRLPKNATAEEITAKYRQLAKEYHPDINPTGAKNMQNINLARETLLKKTGEATVQEASAAKAAQEQASQASEYFKNISEIYKDSLNKGLESLKNSLKEAEQKFDKTLNDLKKAGKEYNFQALYDEYISKNAFLARENAQKMVQNAQKVAESIGENLSKKFKTLNLDQYPEYKTLYQKTMQEIKNDQAKTVKFIESSMALSNQSLHSAKMATAESYHLCYQKIREQLYSVYFKDIVYVLENDLKALTKGEKIRILEKFNKEFDYASELFASMNVTPEVFAKSLDKLITSMQRITGEVITDAAGSASRTAQKLQYSQFMSRLGAGLGAAAVGAYFWPKSETKPEQKEVAAKPPVETSQVSQAPAK